MARLWAAAAAPARTSSSATWRPRAAISDRLPAIDGAAPAAGASSRQTRTSAPARGRPARTGGSGIGAGHPLWWGPARWLKIAGRGLQRPLQRPRRV